MKKKYDGRIVRVGNKNHTYLDNVYTLMKSNNDVYSGCADYLFFKILNLEPVEYFNLCNMTVSEEEIEYYQKDYENFKTKNKFSKKIINDLHEIEKYIRTKAIEENVIHKILDDKYMENSNNCNYNSEYISIKILKYYRNKGE